MARTHLTRRADIDRIKSNRPAGDRIIAKLDEHDHALDALEGGTTSSIVTIHPVRAASTTNISNLASCSTTMDTSVTLVAADRVLLKDQSTVEQNGIYVVGTVSGGNAPLTRATDWDEAAEIKPNTLVAVKEGTASGGTYWQLTGDYPTVVGTSHQHFVRGPNHLTADAIGRAMMDTGFFTEAKATDAFAAQAITGALLKNATVTTTQIASTTIAAGNIANGTITSTQLAASAVAETNVTPSILTGKHMAVGAAGNTVGIIPMLFEITVPDGSTVLDALTLDATYGKVEVKDVYFVKGTTTGGASDAVQLCTDSGGVTAVSSSLALNGIAAGGVVRTTSLTNTSFAAGAHFYVKRTSTTANNGILRVLAYRVA